MLDSIQILLTAVISVLTVLLTIIGLEVFQILKEFKRSLEKINKILDDTGRITESVAEPIEEASDFLIGLKKGISFLRNISRFFKDEKKDKEVEKIEEKSSSAVKKEDSKDKKKRFFTKKGKILSKPA